MHPFHMLLVLFTILSLVAFAFLLRWERGYFLQKGKGNSWFWVRLVTIPSAMAITAMTIIPARTSGMEGLAVFYIILFTIAPVFWFVIHWIVGKLVRPSLSFGESALIAGSPIVLGILLALLAHRLQPIAWSILRSMGMA